MNVNTKQLVLLEYIDYFEKKNKKLQITNTNDSNLMHIYVNRGC